LGTTKTLNAVNPNKNTIVNRGAVGNVNVNQNVITPKGAAGVQGDAKGAAKAIKPKGQP
jgi:hypothetical protein